MGKRRQRSAFGELLLWYQVTSGCCPVDDACFSFSFAVGQCPTKDNADMVKAPLTSGISRASLNPSICQAFLSIIANRVWPPLSVVSYSSTMVCDNNVSRAEQRRANSADPLHALATLLEQQHPPAGGGISTPILPHDFPFRCPPVKRTNTLKITRRNSLLQVAKMLVYGACLSPNKQQYNSCTYSSAVVFPAFFANRAECPAVLIHHAAARSPCDRLYDI